ncbi:SWI/SNF and RSC complex subunit Ssr3 [Schizosaccharomyces japonicus yFS275]|uniref:SWI/SNF and RSC complex subunit Ssr3 n=1 Tax=Schizosaccharomyces japonicus (strain yFS275 / FY16936) TaxID=402676 RepID=B6JWG3_SCHJY|nr:SWI/SNF and RSC complex subunit Ssr3 [Schizosaccharomyces japonicus yFS275]EEB05714.1 SWI/SNF and RSC complex subunit Ssr3 [Schizosaccharomyces japonicus yFS275]
MAEHKSRIRLTERDIPESIAEMVPEAKQYAKLQNLEKRLDSLIMRKKFDLQDSLNRHIRLKRRMRIFISCKAANQQWQLNTNEGMNGYNMNNMPIPQWTLKIEGRLLPETNDNDDTKDALKKHHFTAFFKRVCVRINRSDELYPEGNYVEWNKPTTSFEHTDGIEITRRGDADVNVQISLYPEEHPERYKLSANFAQLLGISEGTRPTIVMALWQYIKFHRLQDMEDKRLINCDKGLQDVFGTDRLYFPKIPELMNKFLQPVDPFSISFTVKVGQEKTVCDKVYDIEVSLEDPKLTQIKSFLEKIHLQEKISELDDKLAEYVQACNFSKAKHDFMQQFANDPQAFIDKWISSQNRDLEIIMDGGGIHQEDKRNSLFYQQPWVYESSFHYLNQLNSKKQQDILNAATRRT